MMGIQVSKVLIKNYKSISSLLILLNDKNVFFGKNNTGKSNILKAISLGFSYESIDAEDVFNSKLDPFSYDKKVTVDIYIKPTANGELTSSFDDDWILVMGDGKGIDENSDSFFAFRTELSFDEKRSVYINIKKQIKRWSDDGDHSLAAKFNSRVLDYIYCEYVDAHRDISEDLRNRKSIWTRLISKIKIEQAKKDEIQIKLQEINFSIKKESKLIQEIEKEMKKTVPEEKYEVNIAPVTKDLETLYKGIDIYYQNEDFNPIPVSNLGSGVRSWAVFSTIKSQINLFASEIIPFHSLLLVEEPEAHVHPQQQMQLVKILNETNSQKIIATHSPYVINQLELETLVRIDKDSSGTLFYPLSSTFSDVDISAIKHFCMSKKADLVFSRLVVMVEGLTELIAMPIFFQYYFGISPFDAGVTFVSSEGGLNYKPFLQLLHTYKLNWLLFSDGELDVIKSITSVLGKITNNPSFDLATESRVIQITAGLNYESYLYGTGFASQIHSAIDSYNGVQNFIASKYMSSQTWAKYKLKNQDNTSLDHDDELNRCTIFYLRKYKIPLAKSIAEKIVSSCSNKDDLPELIINLFKKIKTEVNLDE
jgi:putative ATP-dependent endonuclease of OLD family